MSRKWSPEGVIAALREAQRGGKPMRYSDLARIDSGLPGAMSRQFGSYAQAMAAAGVPIPPGRESWSAERVVTELQRAQREGRSLAFLDMQRTWPKLLGGVNRYHGSYRNALRAAGIDPDTVMVHRRHTRESIIEHLRRRQSEGKSMRPADMREDDVSLVEACQRVYGSSREALKAAGMDTGSLKRRWSRKEVIAELREHHRAGRLRGATSLSVKRLIYSARSHFGNYVDALKAAEIDPGEVLRPRRDWNRDAVLEKLRAYERAGQRMMGLGKIDGSLVDAARRCFGSYRRSLDEAGIKYAPLRESWTSERVLSELRRWHESGELKERRDVAYTRLTQAACWHFGTYQRALAGAGIDPAAVARPRQMTWLKAAGAKYDEMVESALGTSTERALRRKSEDKDEAPIIPPALSAEAAARRRKKAKWRAELYFGPYGSPKTRAGKMLFCERLGTVKVTGFSDGAIPWPKGRLPGATMRPSMVLCGDLVRAVRLEANIAVARAWGVSPSTVWVWRKALGVGRNTPGLHHFAVTDAWRGLTAENRARGLALQTPQRRAEVMEKAKRKAGGINKRRWTPGEDSLLGKMPDHELARRLGCHKVTVRLRRKELGIPSVRRYSPMGLKATTEAGTARFLRYSAEKMKARRLALGTYQKEVSKRCGWVGGSGYSALESGRKKKHATLESLQRVAKALECGVEDLLETDGNSPSALGEGQAEA